MLYIIYKTEMTITNTGPIVDPARNNEDGSMDSVTIVDTTDTSVQVAVPEHDRKNSIHLQCIRAIIILMI